MIVLASDAATLTLLPETGGAIGRLAFGGRDVLRAAPPGATDPLDTACFPLVPFANRIAQGRFASAGREIQLQWDRAAFAHPLHGHGWQAHWRVDARSESSARLSLRHEPDEWPWPYEAEQRIALFPDRVRLTLAVHNTGREAMPIGLGFHPYFPRFPGTRLTAQVDGVWLSDATRIPTHRAGAAHFLDLAAGAELDGAPFVDHCHTGWRGALAIAQPEQGIEVMVTASDAAGFLHLYAPQGESFFCAEPVSAMPDAFNRPEPSRETGARMLEADATLAVDMTIAVRAAALR